jgi:hypothetical protein
MFFQCECIACNSLGLRLIGDGGKGPCNLLTKTTCDQDVLATM